MFPRFCNCVGRGLLIFCFRSRRRPLSETFAPLARFYGCHSSSKPCCCSILSTYHWRACAENRSRDPGSVLLNHFLCCIFSIEMRQRISMSQTVGSHICSKTPSDPTKEKRPDYKMAGYCFRDSKQAEKIWQRARKDATKMPSLYIRCLSTSYLEKYLIAALKTCRRDRR